MPGKRALGDYSRQVGLCLPEKPLLQVQRVVISDAFVHDPPHARFPRVMNDNGRLLQ